MINQFAIQISGVILCIAWATCASYPVYWMLKRRIGLSVSPALEMTGISLDNPEWPYSSSDDISGIEDTEPETELETPENIDWSGAAALLGADDDEG